MCGIAGAWLNPSRRPPEWLAAVGDMTNALRHRGPDGEGLWEDRHAGIALGHRRLAIVDLSEAGRQPMISASGDIVVTYNGEIYNFLALRRELEAAGCRFRGHSDTEVMLAAFERFGVGPALERFAGMFAIAAWDRRERVLHLVRDRMGKKPLYVGAIDGAVFFASELSALHAFPGFHPSVEPAAAAAMLQYGWIPDPLCIFKGVFKLPPASHLAISAGDLEGADVGSLQAKVRQWWSLSAVATAGQGARSHDDSELTEELETILRTVVRERMIADVPLGALLSGGIDSSAVVAMMQAESGRPIRTYTIGFREAHYNEADHAGRVAAHLGTEHTRLDVTPAEALAVIPDLARIWSEPFADELQIPTYLVSRLARQHVTVALSGDGGDECFGGYRRHMVAARLDPLFTLPLSLRRVIGGGLHAANAAFAHPLARRALPGRLQRGVPEGDPARLGRTLAARSEDHLYSSLISADGWLAHQDDMALVGAPPLRDRASRLMYRDMAAYLPGDVLVKVDRASMAVGLQARAPLLDHRIVEFAWRVPVSAKLRGRTSKWILRQVLRRYLPEPLFDRPKSGFDVPVGAWLRGPLREWADDLLNGSRELDAGVLDQQRVLNAWREHLRGRRDRGREVWAALMMKAWLIAEAGRRGPRPVPGEAAAGKRPPLRGYALEDAAREATGGVGE